MVYAACHGPFAIIYVDYVCVCMHSCSCASVCKGSLAYLASCDLNCLELESLSFYV